MAPRRFGARIVILAILATAFAGCATPGPDTEPYTRIKGIGMSNSWGSACLPLSSPRLFEWCVDSEAGFGEFECNPSQLIFSGFPPFALPGGAGGSRMPDRASDRELAPAGEAYVDCEYAFTWKMTARSMMPDSTFTVTAHHAGLNETKSCRLGSSGECSVEGRLDGTFRFDGPGQELNLFGAWEGQLTGMDGGPVPLPGGQTSGEQSWDLQT